MPSPSPDLAAQRLRAAFERGLARGGECGRLIAGHDWAATALGPIEAWPQSLRAAVTTVVCAAVPMVVLWGERGLLLYNDAYAAFSAARHPGLLGIGVCDGWPEARDFNQNVLDRVLAGETLHFHDIEMTLERSGRAENVWMDLDYSPLLDDEGEPGGVLALVVETTARVRAERRVDGERERLQRMFAQAPGFFAMLMGPGQVIALANPAFVRLVGDRELVGRRLADALPELVAQGFAARIAQVYASGETAASNALPIVFERSPGQPRETRFVDIVLQALRDDAGQVEGLFVQGSDVTDRIAAENAARLNDAQFRTFAQVLPNHLWAAAPDGAIDWVNRNVIAYGRLGEGEIAGTGWTGMVHPDDLPEAQRRWAEAVASGQAYEVEFRLRRGDGVYRWHLGRAVPVRDDAGRLVRWIGSNTDIEEQKRAAEVLADVNLLLERQLAERTADRDRMWRLSTDVMLVADFEARIVSVNPAWTQLLGWSQSELTGRSFLDFIHPDDQAATVAEAAVLAAGMATPRFENRYRRRDGSHCVISWTAVPDERFIHAVGRDVTADREAAAVLRRTEAALAQSQKMESVGQLTGGVAHDFNNLLQVISANLQLLARRVAGDERNERYVASALAGVRRGARLASQLLAFARRQPLQPEVVDVGRLVLGMEELLRRTIGESVEIDTAVAEALWPSDVDTAQVENALLNLALNARDAMDGVGRLTIEVGNARLAAGQVPEHPELPAGDYVVVTVADTGAGIPPAIIGRVFEPFFSTKPEGKGTGLGLSMVYGFVRQSGGRVTIDSEVGRGTVVRLYLPRATTDPAAAAAPAPARADGAGGGNETVLVVEDDPEVRAAAVEMLRQRGYAVLEAADAAQALAIVEGGAPVDLLFTDVVMPGPLRSPELARLANARLPHLAVLFTSGYARDAIVHGGRLDAGVELIGKPYTEEALAERVRQVLAARKPPG